jgi:Holliday junction DNA helicase RuvB
LNSRTPNISENIKELLAQRALGNPRVLKQLYQHIMAYSKVVGEMTLQDIECCMDLLGIDQYGLHPCDRRVIHALLKRNNKPIGSEALAGEANIALVDLEDAIEARLVYCGFLERGPKGRILTQKALKIFVEKN